MTTVHRTAIPKVWEPDSFDLKVSSKITCPQRPVIVPSSMRSSVERRTTLPLASFVEDNDAPAYPYGEYWRRAVAAMLLCGRIAAKCDGFPEGVLGGWPPKDYLLIKPKSNPDNFVRRCQELEFKVNLLHS